MSDEPLRFIDCHTHFGPEHLDDFTGSFDDVGLRGVWDLVHHFVVEDDAEFVRFVDAARKRAGDRVRCFYWPRWDEMNDPSFPKRCAAGIREVSKAGIFGCKVWKNLGLGIKDPDGRLARLDDERLNPVWETMVERRLILVAHVADPANFWLPFNESNPSYESLKRRPEWHFGKPGLPSREELFRARNNLHRRFPDLVIVNCHCGGYAESLKQLGEWMDEMPNFHASFNPSHVKGGDPSLGDFLRRHGGRVLFETDLGMRRGKKVDLPWNRDMYERTFGKVRELFAPFGADVLEKYAHLNAERLIRQVSGR